MAAFAAEFHFDGVLVTALQAPHKSTSGQKGLRNEWSLAAPAKANKAYVRIRDWGTTVTVQTCVNRVGAWTMHGGNSPTRSHADCRAIHCKIDNFLAARY